VLKSITSFFTFSLYEIFERRSGAEWVSAVLAHHEMTVRTMMVPNG